METLYIYAAHLTSVPKVVLGRNEMYVVYVYVGEVLYVHVLVVNIVNRKLYR